jgi:hypothetical protein
MAELRAVLIGILTHVGRKSGKVYKTPVNRHKFFRPF